MTASCDQVWVTCVLKDEQVESAILLCCSLRRNYTSRKIAVIISNEISSNLRSIIYHEFDHVLFLDEMQNKNNLNLNTFAKLYALVALRAFDNCAFISPTMMALKNCDDIFSHRTNGFRLLEDPRETCVFVFKPSLQHFGVLLKQLQNGSDLYTSFETLAIDKEQKIKPLESKYNMPLRNGEELIGHEKEMSIVNLENYSWGYGHMQDGEKLGTLERLVLKYREKLQLEYVRPLMNNCSLERDFLPMSMKMEKEPIAIVGMSCRYPGCNNLEEFWNLLFQGQDGTGNPPPFRWLREQCSTQVANARDVNAGFLKDPVDEFDAKFFGISPKEALRMDPQQRLVLELVWEGLEDACMNPHTLRGTPGSVFYGSWINDYKDILEHSGNVDFFRNYMGNSIGAAAARISFLLGLTGPSIATESGCSSGMVAVHLACRSLQNGETNLALACGVNLLLNPFDGSYNSIAISPEGRSKTFSADADGFARAEGGGVLVLKRLSDAWRDGDRIWALIKGSATSQEGTSDSMGTPTVHCESRAMAQALKNAKVEPDQISYVETHGTGTVVGDPIEVAAIAKAYHTPRRQKPLIIGSVKTNVGHTESCSGITGIMKVVLAMKHECIPAHLNFTKLNPDINLDAIPAIIPLERMKWRRVPNCPRTAGVSSFGLTGTDAHVILEEAPINTLHSRSALSVGEEMERPLHIVKLSTKSEQAMDALLQKYKTACQSSKESIADIAFSANTGRADFPVKIAIVAKSKEELCEKIETENYVRGDERRGGAGKICFLFTGQGSQYPGMAKQLYQTSPVFRMHFDLCDKILREMHHIDIKPTIFAADAGTEISRTIYSQPSIFCVEYALLKLWESWGVKPDYVLGHSLGECTAAVCAGILSLRDAVKLVAERSKLIDKLPSGKMLVIRADEKDVEILLTEYADGDEKKILEIAAVNSVQQTVVAGDSEIVLEFSNFCLSSGVKCVCLEATHAFHSKHMDPILDLYRETARSLQGKQSKKCCAYISGLEGNLLNKELINAEYWVRHTREKVNFLSASKKAVELGCRTFIEIGPHPVLSAMTMLNADTVNLCCLPSLRKNADDWSTLLSSLATLYVHGVEIDWNGFDQFYGRKKVSLPHYPFIGKKFWPEMQQQFRGNSIHPLIGFPIPNASSTKLFQSGINLSNEQYLKDHVVGNRIIFPAAGYLEMCLAAGFAAVVHDRSEIALVKPSRPIKVENLSIVAPLELKESKITQLQAVLEQCPENDGHMGNVTVKLYHRQIADSTSKWVAHADATFSSNLTSDDQLSPMMNVNNFQEFVARPSDEMMIEEHYGRLTSLGCNFGPRFKSIEKIWRQEESDLMLFKLKVPYDDANYTQYIVHPIILDAMLQSTVVPKMSASSELYLPIKIGKFVWLSKRTDQSSDLYVQTFCEKGKCNLSSGEITALLLDSTGKMLAIMTGVEVISTTVRGLVSVLEQQINPMPSLWEEVWHSVPGATQYSVHLDCLEGAMEAVEKCHVDNNLGKYNERPDIMMTFSQVSTLAYYYMLKALYECGWEPKVGEQFCEQQLMQLLKIQEQFTKQFRFFLTIFQEEGLLENSSDGTSWTIIEVPPSLIQIDSELASPLFTQHLVEKFGSTLLVRELGANLAEILKGAQSPLSILFPEGSSKNGDVPCVEAFYRERLTLLKIDHVIQQRNRAWFLEYKQKISDKAGEEESRSVFRILEVGAGTGGYTEHMLALLEELEVEFEYTYTDISSSFFPAAEKKFEKFDKQMRFRKLDIEKDPIGQDFVPSYYDIVCAYDVLHATRNLAETMSNVRCLLKPNGFLDILESTEQCRFTTFIFGLVDGYWRFEDAGTRPNHCIISKSTWADVLCKSGFRVVGNCSWANNYMTNTRAVKTEEQVNLVSMGKMKTWIIFHEGESPVSNYLIETIAQLATGRQVVVVNRGSKFQKASTLHFTVSRDYCMEDFVLLMQTVSKEEGDVEGVVYCPLMNAPFAPQEDILRPYFFLVKSLHHLEQRSLPTLVALTNGAVPIGSNTLSNVSSSTIWGFTKSLANENPNLKCKCIDVGTQVHPGSMLQIFYELWSFEEQTQIAFQGLTRHVPRFKAHKPKTRELKIPAGVSRFHLVLPESKLIGDLQFGPLCMEALAPGEIEIQVKSAGLNFRDLMNILKPSDKFQNCNAVGMDFAGVVVRVGPNTKIWSPGDVVFGLQNKYTFHSHIIMHENDVIAIPENVTLSEASTLPLVFATSYSCLVNIAGIKPSDTVLIHAASGGVGLSAIQICKHFGANVIATVGSKRKENYLRSLGIQHVFNSRSTDFEQEILKVTNGRGVDVVLNSLTGPGLKEATLRTCAHGARFAEIGKLNIWKPEKVQQLRPDVKYTVFDLEKINVEGLRQLLATLEECLKTKMICPLQYVRFDGCAIQDALEYMQKAKHIGKIVCVMPEVKQSKGLCEVKTPIFHGNGTYLITGGLGGIGFEVCKWMVDKGAKYILLAGRNAPSAKLCGEIDNLNSEHNARVQTIHLDVSSYQQCEKLIHSTISEIGYPSLRGVMHAAGTLHDGLVEDHTWNTLSSTFPSKVSGTLNLHQVTIHLALEHFVLFSSVAAPFGNPGQSNHGAANQFEDTMAHYRHSIGLPATTVNWGQWGQVGVATDITFPGIKPFSTVQAFTALEYALKSQRTQTCVVNIESFAALASVAPKMVHYVDKSSFKSDGVVNLKQTNLSSSQFWQRIQSAENTEKKTEVVKEMLRQLLGQILQLDSQEKIDDNAVFQEMGVDSLMFVQLKNALQSILGDKVELNVGAVREFNTVQLLSEALIQLIEKESSNTLCSTVPTFESVAELIREDSHLPESIAAKSGQQQVPINKISCVLLTGSSGTLGPYILKELLKNSQITEIICLMRPVKSMPGEERLQKVLEDRDLQNDVDLSKVKCVDGNVAMPHLGMESKIWEELCDKVDAVLHVAACVQHVERYTNQKFAKSMRAVNVGGTKHVLEFASSGSKLKHVFYSSSMLAVAQTDKEGCFLEDWPQPHDFDNVTTVCYQITKFVGEILMKEAVLTRGIPGKAFRFPIITGDSKSGRFVLESSHVMQGLIFCLKHKIMSSDVIPIPVVPVDLCANASVKLFLNPDVPNDIYNLNNTTPYVSHDFVGIAAKLGCKLEVVEYAKFVEKVQASSVQDSAFAVFKEAYANEFDEAVKFMAWYTTWKSLNDTKKRDFMISQKVKKYLPDFFSDVVSANEQVYRDMLFAKSQGWLGKTLESV